MKKYTWQWCKRIVWYGDIEEFQKFSNFLYSDKRKDKNLKKKLIADIKVSLGLPVYRKENGIGIHYKVGCNIENAEYDEYTGELISGWMEIAVWDNGTIVESIRHKYEMREKVDA